jgi:hypothetical protein
MDPLPVFRAKTEPTVRKQWKVWKLDILVRSHSVIEYGCTLARPPVYPIPADPAL